MDNILRPVFLFRKSSFKSEDDKIIWPWNALSAANTDQKIEAQTYYADSLLHIVQPIALACLPFALTYLFTFVESIYKQESWQESTFGSLYNTYCRTFPDICIESQSPY